MLVEVMEPQHVLEAARVFPSPVALNGGFVLQPGPRYLVLRYVEDYQDVQVSVLGYKEFGGYLNFYDPARTLPVIGDRLISLVNLSGSSFLQGRESAPRLPAVASEPPQPLSDTADPFDLPSTSTGAVAGVVAGAAALATAEALSNDDADAASSVDDLLGTTDPEPDKGDDIDLGGGEADLPAEDLVAEEDPFDIPEPEEEATGDDIDDLDSLLGADGGDDSLDITLDDAEDNDPLTDLGFDGDDDAGNGTAAALEDDADPVPADDSEPLSQDSIDDLFN